MGTAHELASALRVVQIVLERPMRTRRFFARQLDPMMVSLMARRNAVCELGSHRGEHPLSSFVEPSSYIVFATSRAVAALFTFLFKYGIKGE